MYNRLDPPRFRNQVPGVNLLADVVLFVFITCFGVILPRVPDSKKSV